MAWLSATPSFQNFRWAEVIHLPSAIHMQYLKEFQKCSATTEFSFADRKSSASISVLYIRIIIQDPSRCLLCSQLSIEILTWTFACQKTNTNGRLKSPFRLACLSWNQDRRALLCLCCSCNSPWTMSSHPFEAPHSVGSRISSKVISRRTWERAHPSATNLHLFHPSFSDAG